MFTASTKLLMEHILVKGAITQWSGSGYENTDLTIL